MRPLVLRADDLSSPRGALSAAPDVVLVDVRADRTLLPDLHVATGDAAAFLGVDPRFTIVDALENTARLDENFFRSLVVHTPSGLDLLGSAVRVLASPVDPQRVRTLIDFAVRYYRAI